VDHDDGRGYEDANVVEAVWVAGSVLDLNYAGEMQEDHLATRFEI
jgi:hypothetical protein